MKTQLNVLSLREQVYDYLRNEIITGGLTPGSTINLNKIAGRLGISKTPLRDALIHLELEGFVTILARRGVMVNLLELKDVKDAYDAIGMIESSIIKDCFDRLKPSHIKKMEKLNQEMITEIKQNNFSRLFKNNIAFHNVFNALADNPLLEKFMLPIKHRLYDFQGHSYIREWELRNCDEHAKIILALKAGDPGKASDVLKNIHWSYGVQEEFIRQFYAMTDQR